ncbi:uncharacterized protein [Lepeophtheirus salmonis]|uniref:uncharacterized protein n=1 Tax=Lepeophtheirus salmonis TaxID=72036 RepID=UPI001AE6C499|nr:uncharacterized protein LOC121129469 [Lepeophtheirus salmonis]
MKIGRVMAALKSSKKLILIIVCLLYLTVAHSASISSPPCGCIEKDRLETLESVSSMVLGSSHSDDQTSKCNLFCSTKSGTRFVNLEQGICHCFSTSQLPTFDCDEILKSSNRNNSKQAVIPVYCPLAAKMKSGTTKSSDGKVDVQEEETQFSISKGIASAAIVLVTLSVVVLILFGLKTCYDNKKTVKLQGSEKCPKKNSSTWNFDEHKIKETRSENNI